MASDQEVVLLPCPLCSHPARTTEPRRSTTAQMDAGYGKWNYGVECAADLACGCCVGEFPDQSEAISAWNTRQAAAAIPPSGEAKLRRCEVTGNPTGTDTWAVGYECKCSACQSMLVEGSVAQPSVFISRAFDPLTTHRFAAPPAPVAIDEVMVEGLRDIKDAADSFRDESGDEVAGQVILRVDALLAALNPQPNGGA